MPHRVASYRYRVTALLRLQLLGLLLVLVVLVLQALVGMLAQAVERRIEHGSRVKLHAQRALDAVAQREHRKRVEADVFQRPRRLRRIELGAIGEAHLAHQQRAHLLTQQSAHLRKAVEGLRKAVEGSRRGVPCAARHVHRCRRECWAGRWARWPRHVRRRAACDTEGAPPPHTAAWTPPPRVCYGAPVTWSVVGAQDALKHSVGDRAGEAKGAHAAYERWWGRVRLLGRLGAAGRPTLLLRADPEGGRMCSARRPRALAYERVERAQLRVGVHAASAELSERPGEHITQIRSQRDHKGSEGSRRHPKKSKGSSRDQSWDQRRGPKGSEGVRRDPKGSEGTQTGSDGIRRCAHLASPTWPAATSEWPKFAFEPPTQSGATVGTAFAMAVAAAESIARASVGSPRGVPLP